MDHQADLRCQIRAIQSSLCTSRTPEVNQMWNEPSQLVFFLLKTGGMNSLHDSRLSILEIHSFILFNRTGKAEALLDIFCLSNRVFSAVSWSSCASGGLLPNSMGPSASVKHRTSQSPDSPVWQSNKTKAIHGSYWEKLKAITMRRN